MEATYASTPRIGPAHASEIRTRAATSLQIDGGHLLVIPTSELNRLRTEIAVDELTGVLQRRAGLAALSSAIDQVWHSAEPQLALAFLDVDGLKAVNDSRGHGAGDAALCGIVHTLKHCLRSQDIVFRYGGDEFVCAFLHWTVESAAAVLLDVWRQLFGERMLVFSVGFAELRQGDDAMGLIARADDCLCAGRRIHHRREWRFAS